MSSHHFVKEGQEPALLILDAPTFDVAGPLLEWAPLIIVAQQAVEIVLSWNIKIDVVLAIETDIPDTSNKLVNQAPLTILSYSQEESPLINALHFLIRTKQLAVNIFANDSDQTIALAESFADQLQITVIDGTLKWSGITSGHYSKWATVKTPFLVKESKKQQSFKIVGLASGDSGYESVAEGVITIESNALFWVGETRF
jgi:hypothetical protein